MSDWKSKVDLILQAAAKRYFPKDENAQAALFRLPIPRLIASLPFIADCPRPDALARKNLDTLLKEVKKPGSHAHRPGMSLRTRLAPGDNLSKAKNPAAAEKGMLLLELASLQDHFRDREADLASRTPNPLNEGMDYQSERDRLMKAIHAISCPGIDEIITAEKLTEASGQATPKDFWFN